MGGTVAAGVGLAAATAGVIALAALRRRWVVVTVEGESMAPTYADGDRVLVRRVGADAVRAGQVVVVERPEVRRCVIKRAVAVPGDPVPVDRVPLLGSGPERRVPEGMLVLLGDNAEDSYDSRRAGYFPAARLVGVVARRLGVGVSRR